MSKNDGGPAFPCTKMITELESVDSHGFSTYVPQAEVKPTGMTTVAPAEANFPGMTLRQWYAGLAMQGLLASMDADDGINFYNSIPAESFKMADEMIAESEKTHD